MKKRLITSAIIIVIALFVCIGFTACSKVEEDAYITGIETASLPCQYYAVGEPFSVKDGILSINYSNGDKTYLSMSDPSVEISHAGTNVADKTQIANLTFKGFKTSFKYHVSKAEFAIDSVTFEYGDEPPCVLYAKTDLRPISPYNELNGLKIVVKYRDDKLENKIIYLCTADYDSNGITVEGWDASTVGQRDMTISYMASNIILPYKIIDKDWLMNSEIDSLFTQKYVKNYMVGDTFDGNGTYVLLIYNSLKTEKQLITSDIINGFSTDAPATNQRFTVMSKNGDVYSGDDLVYNVYDPDDTNNIESVFLLRAGAGILKVNDKLSYNQYLASTLLQIKMRDGNCLNVDATYKGVTIAYEEGDSYLTLTENSYYDLLKKGQTRKLKIYYKFDTDNLSYSTSTYVFHVQKEWIRTEITGWNDNFTVATDGIFDFEEAKLKKIYNDGTSDTVMIQNEYNKAIGERIIRFVYIYENPETHSKAEKDVQTFIISPDTQSNYYYIIVTTSLSINGEEKSNDTGRLYINFSISPSA